MGQRPRTGIRAGPWPRTGRIDRRIVLILEACSANHGPGLIEPQAGGNVIAAHLPENRLSFEACIRCRTGYTRLFDHLSQTPQLLLTSPRTSKPATLNRVCSQDQTRAGADEEGRGHQRVDCDAGWTFHWLVPGRGVPLSLVRA